MLTLFVLLLLPVLFAINLNYSQPLYNLGVDLILYLQRNSTPTLNHFMIAASVIFDPAIILVACLLPLIFFKRKLSSYGLSLFLLINSYLSCLLKMFTAAPRPFWTNPDVTSRGVHIPKDYGSPSTHAHYAGIVAGFLIFEFLDTGRRKIIALLAVLIMFLVPLSRLYLGMHSLDQVSYGLLVGIAMSYLFVRGGLREGLKKVVAWQKMPQYLAFQLIMFGICYGLLLIGYHSNREYFKQHPGLYELWTSKINERLDIQLPQSSLMNDSLLKVGTYCVSLMAGLSLGLGPIIRIKGTPAFLEGEWKYKKIIGQSWLAAVLHYLIGFGLFFGGFYVVQLIPMFICSMPQLHIVLGNLGFFAGGHLFSMFTYPLSMILGVIEVTSLKLKKS